MALVKLVVKFNLSVKKEDHEILERSGVSTDLTWADFFSQNEVLVDAKKHYVKGSVFNALLDEKIDTYYKRFIKQMAAYKVTLSRKPSHMIKHEQELEEAIRKSLTERKKGDEIPKRITFEDNPPPVVPPEDQEAFNLPHGSKRMRFSPILQFRNSKVHPAGKRYEFSDQLVGEHEKMDEDTQAGNNVPDKDKAIADDIRIHFQTRVNNTDILQVRNELSELKRERNYFRLTRLVSFTAGFLENTFLIDHNS